MTRFEAYLNLWGALSIHAGEHAEDGELARLVDDMNPYWYGFEASKDIYIYQRYEELWVRENTTYTPGEDNAGFTFGKKFFTLLPETDTRFQAGRKAMQELTQEEWNQASYTNVLTGTFMLLYYILKNRAPKDEACTAFLEKMNPFAAEAGQLCPDRELSDLFVNLSTPNGRPIPEVSYDLAGRFLDKVNNLELVHTLRGAGRSEWDRIRLEEPLAFRTMPADE